MSDFGIFQVKTMGYFTYYQDLYLTLGCSFHSCRGAARDGGANFPFIATQKIISLKLQRNILQHQQILEIYEELSERTQTPSSMLFAVICWLWTFMVLHSLCESRWFFLANDFYTGPVNGVACALRVFGHGRPKIADLHRIQVFINSLVRSFM